MMRIQISVFVLSILPAIASPGAGAPAGTLRVHRIFSSNMVIQRGKPIKVWGWAKAGQTVTVRFGPEKARATVDGDTGRWEVTFPAREADPIGRKLVVAAGEEKVEMDGIVVGDVWVMAGQSNMAFPLGRAYGADLETATAKLPLLREIRIAPNESYNLQEDVPDEKVSGWSVCTPDTAGGSSAIGYAFASRLQRALRIPVGIIDNARGGSAIESWVPRHKFDAHPIAAKYLAWVQKRRAEFDWDAAVARLTERWKRQVAELRNNGVPEAELPPKPTRRDLRSWSVPGRSPMDAAACYNGMFGVFKGLNIKGVLFHQGYNNAMSAVCRPKRYRVLMKLMAEGWREDFNDAQLPVGVIGFCAGGITQSEANFEIWSNHRTQGAFIREAQRLGLEDLKDPDHTEFIPAYDIRIPGLHPRKKLPLGFRAARWALNEVYGRRVAWETAGLVSAERRGDRMVLTFEKPVEPDDKGPIEGFALAGEDGVFYKAYAESLVTKDSGIWGKQYERTKVFVWSPLVQEPVAVRYAWAASPMGNLKVRGLPWQPLPSFRTDRWDLPEPEDPALSPMSRGQVKKSELDSIIYCEHRKTEEAKRAAEILARLKTLGSEKPQPE